jgi:hypothetical protein
MRNLGRAAAAALALSLVLFGPAASATATGSPDRIAATAAGSPRSSMAAVVAAQDEPPHNFTGVWWKSPAAAEAGWGINFAHQGNVVFATWFTYGTDNKPQWFIILADKTATNVYAGPVSSVTGPPFNSVPFPSGTAVETVVGTATITFSEDGHSASFNYTVSGITQTKPIIRQEFATPRPTCVWGLQTDLTLATNYQDLWWATGGSEAGWGINFNHQGKVIFATWFTYDTNGKPWWLIVLADQTGPKVFSGPVSAVTGPPFSAVPFDPNTVVETPVGNATITIIDGNHVKFDYTVNGVTQTKNLTRQVFVEPGTVCSFPDQSASYVTQLTDLAGKANRGELSDGDYLTQLAALLATIDGTPGAVQQLEAYLEASIVGHGIPFTVAAADGATKALNASLIATIKASPAYQLLLAAYASVTFSPTPDPSGNFLQVTNPTAVVALSTIAVRTQILDAEAGGGITPAQAATLFGFVTGNPYDALRRLYILQGVAIPAWLLPAPIACVVNCVDVTRTYAGPLSEQAVLTFKVGPFSCTQTVAFTGNVNLALTVHPDRTVNGTAGATGIATATPPGNAPCLPPTTAFSQSVAITGTVDGFTAVINVGNGLFPGTLVGHLDGNTIIGQIQVTNSLGGGTVVLNFTLTPI